MPLVGYLFSYFVLSVFLYFVISFGMHLCLYVCSLCFPRVVLSPCISLCLVLFISFVRSFCRVSFFRSVLLCWFLYVLFYFVFSLFSSLFLYYVMSLFRSLDSSLCLYLFISPFRYFVIYLVRYFCMSLFP